MDEESVTWPVPMLEESLVAGSHLCDQVARLLGSRRKARRAGPSSGSRWGWCSP